MTHANESRVSHPKLVIALVPAMVLPFLATLLYFVILSGTTVAQIIYSATKVFTVVWPFIVIKWWWRTEFRIPLRAKNPLGDAIEGSITGILIAALLFVVMVTPIGDFVITNAGAIRERTQHLGVLNYFWAFAIFLSVIHSFIEEYYWRWFVFGSLRTVSHKFIAHLVAAIAFASHHVVVITQFFGTTAGLALGAGVAFGGFVWSFQYDRRGGILGAWISHMIVDFAIMLIGYRLITF